MQIKDWTELKSGDIFRLHGKPDLTWLATNRWHSWYQPYSKSPILARLEGDQIKIGLDGTTQAFFNAANKQLKQAIEVLEVADIDGPSYAGDLATRLNERTGSDPEIFVVHGPKQTLLPAFRFLSEKPAKGQAQGSCAYPYRDGFAAECYIASSHCHGFLIDHLREGLQKVRNAAKKYDRTAELTLKNTFQIHPMTMKSAGDDEVALGCKPSLNAYDDNPVLPANAREFPLRFAGGHVHFQLPRHEKSILRQLVKGADLIAAVPCVAMFASIDDPVRRNFYGRAGEYRTPTYGLEYRVLSNAWLAHPKLSHLVLNLVRCGLKVGKSPFVNVLGIDETGIREIINTGDVDAARKWTKAHYPMFDSLLKNDGVTNDARTQKKFREIVEGGVEAVFPDYQDLPKNWKLEGSWANHSDADRMTWAKI